MWAEYIISVFADIGIHVSTDDQELVFGKMSDKGTYFVIKGGNVCLITGIGETVDRNDCSVEFDI